MCTRKDSDQPGHPPSLIIVFTVHSMGSWGPNLSSCRQRRLRSDWADAQVDLSLHWAHIILSILSCGGSNVNHICFSECFVLQTYDTFQVISGAVSKPGIHTVLLGSLPVLSAHSFASNWPLPFLNQRKRENGCRNYLIMNLHERMLQDMRIKPQTILIPGGRASDRATAPGYKHFKVQFLRQTCDKIHNYMSCHSLIS